MDVRSLISKADSLFPNLYSFVSKSDWLFELDRKIYEELLSLYGIGHSPSEEEKILPDRELLLDAAFSDVYLYYLFMQFELNSGNITGYQNRAALFNRAYIDLMNHINRTHLMKPKRINIE